nr:putative uncharacterized protein ENSP00000383309 [Penaeus vannamei]
MFTARHMIAVGGSATSHSHSRFRSKGNSVVGTGARVPRAVYHAPVVSILGYTKKYITKIELYQFRVIHKYGCANIGLYQKIDAPKQRYFKIELYQNWAVPKIESTKTDRHRSPVSLNPRSLSSHSGRELGLALRGTEVLRLTEHPCNCQRKKCHSKLPRLAMAAAIKRSFVTRQARPSSGSHETHIFHKLRMQNSQLHDPTIAMPKVNKTRMGFSQINKGPHGLQRSCNTEVNIETKETIETIETLGTAALPGLPPAPAQARRLKKSPPTCNNRHLADLASMATHIRATTSRDTASPSPPQSQVHHPSPPQSPTSQHHQCITITPQVTNNHITTTANKCITIQPPQSPVQSPSPPTQSPTSPQPPNASPSPPQSQEHHITHHSHQCITTPPQSTKSITITTTSQESPHSHKCITITPTVTNITTATECITITNRPVTKGITITTTHNASQSPPQSPSATSPHQHQPPPTSASQSPPQPTSASQSPPQSPSASPSPPHSHQHHTTANKLLHTPKCFNITTTVTNITTTATKCITITTTATECINITTTVTKCITNAIKCITTPVCESDFLPLQAKKYIKSGG